MKVSVIIPCHNSTGTLGLQLAALSQQVDAPDFEVIISDNGSTDDLGGFLADWQDQLSISYVWAGQYRGAAYARNVGIGHANGAKLLFCDSDDLVASDWVARGSAALDQVPVFSGPGLHLRPAELDAGLAACWQLLDAALPPTDRLEVGESVAWPIILGGNSGLRREVAQDLGGYDAGLPGSIEDNDLAVRLQDAGYVIAAAPGVRIAYRQREGVKVRWLTGLNTGRWHMALCQRHDLWQRSPALRGGWWRLDLARVGVAGAKMLLRPSGRDWPGLAFRAGLAIGMWRGWFTHALRNQQPPQRIGLGLVDDRAVLLLSPHLDDAWFSAATVIETVKPEVWTVFAGQPDPPQRTDWDQRCGYPDSSSLMTQRLAEDAAAFAGSGATFRHLDALDRAYTTPQRRAADLAMLAADLRQWVADHADRQPIVVIPAGAGVQLSPSLLDRLRFGSPAGRAAAASNETAPSMAEAAPQPRPAAGPLPKLKAGIRRSVQQVLHWDFQRRRSQAQAEGMLANPDHLVVRDTALAVLGDQDVEIWLYEELPYLWGRPADAEVRRLARKFGVASSLDELACDRHAKQRRIAAYSSQLDVMDPQGRLSSATGLPSVERRWRWS